MRTTKVVNTFCPELLMKLPDGFKSPKGRKAFATKLSSTFQNYLNMLPENKIPINAYKDAVYKTITPLRPKLNLLNSKEEYSAHINFDLDIRMLDKDNYDHQIDHKGFNLYLQKTAHEITCDKLILVHETRHLFDYMCNPKFIVPRGNHFIKNKDCKEITLFNNILEYVRSNDYKPSKMLGLFKQHDFEQIMRENLKNFDNDFVIDLLQRCRYSIQMELNAYKEMGQYAIKTNLLNLFKVLRFQKEINDEYEFSHKKNVINRLLKEYIQKERTNHCLALQELGKSH